MRQSGDDSKTEMGRLTKPTDGSGIELKLSHVAELGSRLTQLLDEEFEQLDDQDDQEDVEEEPEIPTTTIKREHAPAFAVEPTRAV